MIPSYKAALPQIKAQLNMFLDNLNVSIPPHRKICIELVPGSGDGIVTGTVKVTLHCDLQVADWLISGAQGAGQPESTEAG
jgi:hypothetical protein